MMKRIFYFLTICLCIACQDDDIFSTSTGLRLDFSVDTLRMDTVFTRTPSSTYTFWVHNRNDKGVRLSSVKLARGNQSGFRVNVDGAYLDNSNGSQVSDLELRGKDSLLVFLELTAPETYRPEPVMVEDDLVFQLESGTEQRMRLRAWAWDAVKLHSPVFSKDSVFTSDVPVIVFGDMEIAEGATLTIRNTTLYFHDGAGIEVYGKLRTEDCTMRGDRLDRMFSYLPYDRVSGQWKGIHFYESSTDNELIRTEIRNPLSGIVCDSAALDDGYRLKMQECIVHNCQGAGLKATNSRISLTDCQLTNTLGNCLELVGGIAEISYCTLAQFYPFSADRGVALWFSGIDRLLCEGSILTGYADDVLMGELQEERANDYLFRNCLLRTPNPNDEAHFIDIIWETPKDSIQGKQQFRVIDEDNLYYDFHLDSLSTATGLGCYR